ncbi:MAG TPA: FkbM family methyltransferase [Phycisphaerae bacterium]|nr:FkbM family methyltransferase [Phycisphaerae bacterium]
MQVGANDGIRGDPLRRLILANPRWRGIFIEPLDEMFQQLVSNYAASDRFAFERVAISETNGERLLYYVSQDTIREAGLPAGFDTINSFSREHILMHLRRRHRKGALAKAPEAYISSRMVRCERLECLLDRHRVDHVDAFCVDTEGYDYQVIRQIDFKRFRAKLILYEHGNLGSADQSSLAQLLTEQGYILANYGKLNTVAVRRDRRDGAH